MRPEIVDKVRQLAEARRAGGPASRAALEPWSCDETPPPLFYTGLEQFNREEYFEQHESLEEIWALEQRPIRYLYQGILKIGVGLYKLRLGNYRGTVNHLNGGIAYLEPFGDNCMGVDVARLIRDAASVRDQVVALGPTRITDFDLAALPKVFYQRKTED